MKRLAAQLHVVGASRGVSQLETNVYGLCATFN